MGYSTRYTGQIDITPPIPVEDVIDSGFASGTGVFGGLDKDIALKVSEVPVEGTPGAYRRLAVALIPLIEGGYSGYHIVEHVQEVIDRWGEGRTFTGRLDCAGDESGDLWRLAVVDGRAVRIEPRIVWPDDEPTPTTDAQED
jgi:hypothetical protein